MVVPPQIALREPGSLIFGSEELFDGSLNIPVSQVSPVGVFGCSRWTWESTPPGVITAPPASNTTVDSEHGKLAPMQLIMPSLIPISWPSMVSDALTFGNQKLEDSKH